MDDQAAAQQQDALRPLRMFLGALQGALGSDQSYAGTDAVAYNPPRQFVVIGAGGQAVEGQPIVTAPAGGGFAIPAWIVWAAAGAVAYAMFKKG